MGDKLVRARVKRVEDLPDWAKCCERMLLNIEAKKDHELDAILGSEFIGEEVECPFCHRIAIDRPYRETTSGKPICLELYEFDEELKKPGFIEI